MRNYLLNLLIFLPSVLIGQIDHWETVVYEDDTWRYLIPSASVNTTWTTTSFNDANWNVGSGGFGYGDGDDNTTFGSTISSYQRRIFTVIDKNVIDEMVLNIDYDDAFVAYINGFEIGRSNITSAGQPAFNQLSDGQHESQMYQGGSPDQIVLDNATVQSLLNNGNNVLCIQTHNATAGSSDMTSRVWLHAAITNTSNDYGSTPPWFNPPLTFSDSNLPIIVINTAGGQSVPDDPKVDATMGIIYNGPGVRNYMSDPFNEYLGNIGIETRGSSSQGFPKKQYGIETRDPQGVRHDVTVFNMAYDNDWVLYAPYSDKSLIRNVLAYEMGWDTENYAPRTQLCEVVLNGQYDGVYVFTEKIKRKDGKVGLDDVEPEDLTGNELTGDYIVKVDKLTGGGVVAWTSPYPHYPGATNNTFFQMHDPPLDSLHPTQLNYLQSYITSFEDALFGTNFTDPVLGYRPFIDVESFVDFMLVNEVSKNVDGYRISTYLHKLRVSEGGKFVAGPLWDFNLAFGNANYCDGGNTAGWEIDFYQVCPGGSLQNPYWWKQMTNDPEYVHLLNCKYQELRQGPWSTANLMNRIDSLAVVLEESQQRNFQRWPILGNYVWPNNFVGNTYAEEIDYLKTWITTRLNWIDANIPGSCTDLGIEENSLDALVYPNPTDRFIDIDLPVQMNDFTLSITDQYGRSVLNETYIAGSHVTLDLEQFEEGIYYYKIYSDQVELKPGKIILTNKSK